jgi:hypothetical protein
VNLLNTRVEVNFILFRYFQNTYVVILSQVLQDMLQLLKESVSSRHSERLEQIVIALIGVEIGLCPRLAFMLFLKRTDSGFSSVLGIITILVDLFS